MKKPVCDTDLSAVLEQAVTAVMKAIAQEEAVCSDILTFERDLLQKAKDDAANLEEFVAIHEMVNGLIHHLAPMQATAQWRLMDLREMLYRIERSNQSNAREDE